MNSPLHSSEELFHRLLDESSALLAAPESAGMAIPDDELHREIIMPLLPAMLGDKAIRGHWSEQHATGFVARITRHFENGDPAPRWMPGDFEIHVTASYSAGPDARALADTLLSEESLRDMTAALMNQLLDALWTSLAPAPAAAAAVSAITATGETAVPKDTSTQPEAQIYPAEIPPSEIHAARRSPSVALVRTLCRRLPGSASHRGIIAVGAQRCGSAAITARRIVAHSTDKLPHTRPFRGSAVTRGFPSRRGRPGCQ